MNQPQISLAQRFIVPVVVVIAGMIAGSGMASGYNGHGPEAGFAGLLLFFGLCPALAGVASLVAMFARNTKYGNIAMFTSVFFFSMIAGGLFTH